MASVNWAERNAAAFAEQKAITLHRKTLCKELGEAALSLEERFVKIGCIPHDGNIAIRAKDQILTLPGTAYLSIFSM